MSLADPVHRCVQSSKGNYSAVQSAWLVFFRTRERMPCSVAGMLLTDLKARMAESEDEVRGISDILLKRVSGGRTHRV